MYLHLIYVFFQGKFSRPPYVLVSSEHTYAGRNHDAATVWAENVEVGKFTVCSREMQNFDGLHEDIIVVSEKINIKCCLSQFNKHSMLFITVLGEILRRNLEQS